MLDLIVVGGGPAGVTAALRARELGASVALVERGRLGGTCTNDGCVPMRVLAKAARLARDARQFEDYGLSPSSPVVDFPRLMERTRETVALIHQKKQIAAHLETAGVSVYENAGQSRFEDEHTLALPGSARLQAEKFLLCVGGHARRLPFSGSELALTPGDLWQLQTLPPSMAIIGASATGCQLASVLAAFGVQVWLLEMAPRLLPMEDSSVSHALTKAFRRSGIEVITGIGGVESLETLGESLRLEYRRTKEADQSAYIETGAVVIAAGWPGNVAGLNLEAAGVRTEREYVVVDDALRTSARHIFAAGDITGRMLLVQSAQDEGRIAAENAVLGTSHIDTRKVVPRGGFTDPEYGSVGLTEEKAREQEDCVVTEVPYADLDRAVIDGRPEGICKLVVSRHSNQILGAHVVGEQALEVVQVVAAAMASEGRVDTLAQLELAYPTFTGILGLAARQLCRETGLMEVVCPAPGSGGLSRRGATEWEHTAQGVAGETSLGE